MFNEFLSGNRDERLESSSGRESAMRMELRRCVYDHSGARSGRIGIVGRTQEKSDSKANLLPARGDLSARNHGFRFNIALKERGS